MIIDVLEGSQVDAAQCDAWGPSTIPPLPEVYWDDKNKRIGLLFPLLAASVLVTCLHPNSPLPVTEWRDDMRVHHIGGPEVERFFALLTGTQQQVDGSLLEDAALALRRIREDTLSPQELYRCHFQLLNALFSGEWGEPVGDALAKIVVSQWANVSAHQLFALTSPSLYAPLLKKQCEDPSRSGFSKIASVLKTAAAAAGVSLPKSVADFLTRVENGGRSIPDGP